MEVRGQQQAADGKGGHEHGVSGTWLLRDSCHATGPFIGCCWQAHILCLC
jgi:hypothetical protein